MDDQLFVMGPDGPEYGFPPEPTDDDPISGPAPAPMNDRCTFDPSPLLGVPLGMFHCPECGEMVIAGLPHFESPA